MIPLKYVPRGVTAFVAKPMTNGLTESPPMARLSVK